MVRENNKRQLADWGPREAETAREGSGERAAHRGLRLLTSLAAVALASAPMLLVFPAPGTAQERLVSLSAARRTASVAITAGKTQDVRVDAPFSDVMVGDPEVADVTPLTDHSLSILGKKIGMTRVSVYGEGRRTVGVFDIEVSYDVSAVWRWSSIGSPAGGSRVSSVNGRIMLSGTAPDAVTLDKAVVIARQFAPDVINAVQVLQPQQVVLEVRFVEASREAGRELGVQWNTFGKNTLTNIGSQVPAGQLPVTQPAGVFQQPGLTVGGQNVAPSALTISPIAAAGVLSGVAPFGFLLGALNRGNSPLMLLSMRSSRKVSSAAWRSRISLRCPAIPRAFWPAASIRSRCRARWERSPSTTRSTASAWPLRRRCCRDGLINLKIEPEVSELDRSNPVVIAGISVPPLIVRRASTTIELRDGQSFVIGGLLQNKSTTHQQQLPWLGDVPVLGALFSSKRYQKDETDLAIIVTPRLVRPTRPGDLVKTPLDNTLPANDIDFFLMGKAEVTPADARLAVGHQRRFVGHILDLRKEGANVVQVKN